MENRRAQQSRVLARLASPQHNEEQLTPEAQHPSPEVLQDQPETQPKALKAQDPHDDAIPAQPTRVTEAMPVKNPLTQTLCNAICQMSAIKICQSH